MVEMAMVHFSGYDGIETMELGEWWRLTWVGEVRIVNFTLGVF